MKNLISLTIKTVFLVYFIAQLGIGNNLYSQWVPSGSVSNLYNYPSVSVVDKNTVFLAGGSNTLGPRIYRSTNGGLNFATLPTNGLPNNVFLSCVWGVDANTIYAGVGSTVNPYLVNNAKVYKTTNGGTNWNDVVSTNGRGFYNGVVFSRTNPLVGIINSDPPNTSGEFYIWKTLDGGNSWTLYRPGAPNAYGAQNSLFVVDENFFGFGLNVSNARVAITTNGGTDWNYYTLIGAGGTQGFVSTVAFNVDKLNGMAGTDNTSTTISRTTNGGLNWFSQSIPCTISGHCNINSVVGTNTFYVVISNNSSSQSFKSEDNGETWTPYTFPGSARGIKHVDLDLDVADNPLEENAYLFSISSLGTIFKLQDSPLPVTLYSFNYTVNQRDVNLKWSTSWEENNYGFEVYRLLWGKNEDDPNNWIKIGFIQGKGNSNVQTDYSFTDKKLGSGKYTYKLKQIDYNGNSESFSLSGYAEIKNPGRVTLSQNYPNPFNPLTNIEFEIPADSRVTLKVYDITGREALNLIDGQRPAGYHKIEINGNTLASGYYFYRLTVLSNGEVYTITKKMSVVK